MVDTMRGFGKITIYIIMQTLGKNKESGTERGGVRTTSRQHYLLTK